MYYNRNDYNKMDGIIYQILEDYEIFKFPLDIIALANKMGIGTIPFSTLPLKTRNLLLSNPKTATGFHSCDKTKGYPKYIIFYNDYQSEGRWRITIGHEIKHIVCNDGSNPSRKDEDLAEYFGKQLNGPRCYLFFKGIITPTDIMDATGLGPEAVSYIATSFQKRIAASGNSLYPDELGFIDYIKEMEQKNK